MNNKEMNTQATEIELLQQEISEVELQIKTAYQRLQHSQNLKQEEGEIKQEFLSNFSHELRTPLNSIIGFARLIQKEKEQVITADQYTEFSIIINNGHHLLSLVDDLLNISQQERWDKISLHKKQVDLNHLVQDVLLTIRIFLKRRTILLKADLDPKLPKIFADQIRLRQILINLLHNAAKNTDDGEICISTKRLRKNVLISVSDTGRGINAEQIKKIFRPYVTLNPNDQGGVGLGLVITKSLVEKHKGKIRVISTDGKGTTFEVVLPITK